LKAGGNKFTGAIAAYKGMYLKTIKAQGLREARQVLVQISKEVKSIPAPNLES